MLRVPAADAAIANSPYGVSCRIDRVARDTAWLAVRSTSINTSLRSTPIRATPTTTENSTTAGTMLFASELKGFDGM